MIELGTSSKGGPGAAVKDATDASFMADVIEASRETPIIVDFWAPWCGPCKTLGPQLEAAVTATNGKVRMVKVDVDQNQAVAGQLRVQSIPAVFAFVDGRPVDGFMGAVTPAEVNDFVGRLAKSAGGDALGEALDAADQMLEQGAVTDAAETYAAVLEEDPGNVRAIAGMIRATLAIGDIPRARAMLGELPPEMAADPLIAAARAAIDLAEQAETAGETDELRARIAANPDDHEARFELSVALSASGDHAGAIEELLELFRRDREWNDGAAREQMMTIFDTLGPKDPVGLRGRRRLSSMIFA